MKKKDWSAMTVHLMKAIWQKLLDALVLEKILFENLVNFIDLSPLYPSLELVHSIDVVEVLAVQQTSIYAVFENHLVDIVEYFCIVYLFDELLQRGHLSCVE